MDRTLVLFVVIILVVGFFAIFNDHLYMNPDCVHTTGMNTVKVDKAFENAVPIGCDAREIKTYLTQHDFEQVDEDFDYFYYAR